MVFGPCQGIIRRPTEKRILNWKGAAIQREPEHGNRGIAIVGAVTRQLLMKTLQSYALVICKVWRSVMVL
jgi:hypothetical protein